jgi:DNA excision repair protein ERCC-4
MKIEDLRMVVDERERKSGIPDLLKEVGVKVELKNLPIGDYIVASETVVERKSVYDFISSVFDGRLLDFKIPVIPTPNASHTAKLLIAMCARQGSIKGPFLKKIRKSGDLNHHQLSVLCSLPGVGEKLATRMLERFGSPNNSLNASAVDLSKIKGMGEARAQKIRKILDAKIKSDKKTGQTTLHDL